MTMNIDYSTKLVRVGCVDSQDSYTDVVKHIEWEVSFFDTSNPEVKTMGHIETVLDTDNLNADSYVLFSDVSKAQILAWALTKQGGNDFLDGLLEAGHAARLEELLVKAQFTAKDLDSIPD